MAWTELAEGTDLDRVLHDIDAQSTQLVPLLESLKKDKVRTLENRWIDGSVIKVDSLSITFGSSFHDSMTGIENNATIQRELTNLSTKKGHVEKNKIKQAAECLISHFIAYREFFFIHALLSEDFSDIMGSFTSVYGHHNLEFSLPELLDRVKASELKLADIHSKLEDMCSKESVMLLFNALNQEVDAVKHKDSDGKLSLRAQEHGDVIKRSINTD